MFTITINIALVKDIAFRSHDNINITYVYQNIINMFTITVLQLGET